MEQNALQVAKNYQKQRQWGKAAALFQQYMKNNQENCDATVFAAYARSLRFTGETDKAEKVLQTGKRQHPESERILLEFHNLYDFLGQWETAEEIAKSLVKKNPNKPNYHFRLGRTYSFLEKPKQAKKAYRKALEQQHGLSFKQLTTKIQAGFATNPEEVSSTYVFMDGKNNLGAFIHDYKGKKYFTKIASYKNNKVGAGREETFYKQLSADFPQLEGLAPKYIDAQVIDKIAYLTIEWIDAVPAAQKDIKTIIPAVQRLSSIGFQSLNNSYPNPDYVFQYKKGRAISVVHFFTQIHQAIYNEKMFESIQLIMKQHRYPNGVRKIIERLKTVVVGCRLYEFIEPEKHYALLHGDFAFQNVMIDKKTGSPKVIDWTSFTTGPHFIDVARLFTSLLIPYQEVKRLYLEDDQTGGRLSQVEQIFFLYALILFYFQKLGRKGLETELSIYLLPALEDLERLVVEFSQTEEGKHVEKNLSLPEDENALKIKQLEQKLDIIQEERDHLQERLDGVLNSKSWRITMPLRLFTERKQKKR